MAISLVGSATGAASNATTTDTITIPAGVQTGDVLLIALTSRDSTNDCTVTDDDTGGNAWAKIVNQAAATNGCGQLWWKRATSGTASKTVTVGSGVGSLTCGLSYFRGGATGYPFGTPVGEANASGNEVQAGITTTRVGSMVVHTVHCTSNDTLNPGNRTATSPTSIAEVWEDTSTGGNDCSTSLAAAIKAVADATGNISWSQTNGVGASIAIEIRANNDDIDAQPGSFALTGVLATLAAGLLFNAEPDTFALSGVDAGLSFGYAFDAQPASFSLTGADVGLSKGFSFSVDPGAFAITGTAAEFRYFVPGAPSGALAGYRHAIRPRQFSHDGKPRPVS